ncbi:MFS transporter [Marinomonas hwangdonensis]|uniref:MFS transporter n=1 Tax=Marinomonas hwangdonensis TaxID=1053647 RepID=A0A3M8Q1H8_9GAMM|nr:VC0807 family protein [Marinomonas hwangdonensis]MDP5056423.1 MFS transporter [Marinomonas hwangdonensis]RNF49662.1 MFS transporter [Marinomonas hwangdonensis]
MNQSATHKPRPMVDLIVSVILPSFILMKLSGDENLGVTGGLMVALAFPLGWGAFELIKYKKFNFIALLGLISVMLTGSIGLFELDNKWLAIKEATIPAIIGIAVLVSTFTPYPLVRALLFNAAIMDVDMINRKLEENNSVAIFEKKLMNATYFVAGSFAFSAVMNYVLAKWIVTSPAGTAAFNEELGQMTLYSYPVIAIPSMIMMMSIFYYLWRSIHKATGLKLEDLMVKK